MTDVAATRDRLLDALEGAIVFIEWDRSITYEEVAETIDGWPRYELCGRPNKRAMQRANEIREIAGLPLVDYAKEYRGCGFKYRPIPPAAGGYTNPTREGE